MISSPKIIYTVFVIFSTPTEAQNITARNGFVTCSVPDASKNNLENLQCSDAQFQIDGTIKESTKCTFDCIDGTALIGDVSELVCRDDGNVEFLGFCKCDECCDAPPYKPDLSITCSNGYRKKSTCEVSCLTGVLDPVDSPTTITCQKKEKLWTAPWPDCISGETTTETITTTEALTETTAELTTQTTSFVSTSIITTTTTEPQTTLADNEDNSIVGLRIEILGPTTIQMTWNDLSNFGGQRASGSVQNITVLFDQIIMTKKSIQIVAIDQFGDSTEIPDIDPSWTGYTWTGATSGFKYLIRNGNHI